MDDFKKAMQKEPDCRDFGCGCCGSRLNRDARHPHRRRARARLKQAVQREVVNGD